MSGAVPSPAARPLERAARVPRPACPGCGRCGCGDPAPAPQRASLRAGVARCGGGGRASPGGVPAPFLQPFPQPGVPSAVGAGLGTQQRPHSVRPCGPALLALRVAEELPGGGAFHHCEGRLRSGAVPFLTAHPLGGPLGSATHVLWARVCGCGGPTLSPWPACPVGAVCRGGGGGPSPGGVACHRCEGRLVSGAVPPPAARPLERAARVPRPGVLGAVDAGVGTKHGPHSVRPCGPALLAVGVAEGRPRGGGAFHHCEGRLRSGAVPPPTARPLGRAVGVRHPRAVVAGVWVWGPNTVPLARMPCGGCVPRGWSGAVPGGGWPATVVRGVCCQALSLPRPPVPWSCQSGFRDPCVPGAVGAGVGTQHLPQHAPLRAGVARCGGGGRASPGGVPSTIVRGV